MDVNINGIRRVAIEAYNSLCDKLNAKINDGEIQIDVLYIQRDIEDLRGAIATLGMIYDPKQPGEFDVVYDPEKRRMSDFNPEDES